MLHDLLVNWFVHSLTAVPCFRQVVDEEDAYLVQIQTRLMELSSTNREVLEAAEARELALGSGPLRCAPHASLLVMISFRFLPFFFYFRDIGSHFLYVYISGSSLDAELPSPQEADATTPLPAAAPVPEETVARIRQNVVFHVDTETDEDIMVRHCAHPFSDSRRLLLWSV